MDSGFEGVVEQGRKIQQQIHDHEIDRQQREMEKMEQDEKDEAERRQRDAQERMRARRERFEEAKAANEQRMAQQQMHDASNAQLRAELRNDVRNLLADSEGVVTAAMSGAKSEIIGAADANKDEIVGAVSGAKEEVLAVFSSVYGKNGADKAVEMTNATVELRKNLDLDPSTAALIAAPPLVMGVEVAPLRMTRSAGKSSVTIDEIDIEKRVQALQVLDEKIEKAAAEDVPEILASTGVIEALAYNLNPDKPKVESSVVNLIKKYAQVHAQAFKPVAKALEHVENSKVKSVIAGIEAANLSMV